jgi:hypothetical protein
MERKNEIRFWIVFVSFSITIVAAGELTGQINLATMSRAEQVIYTATLVLCGIAIRHWFKDAKEVKKHFKS